jgi:hypothetical protein
MASFSMFLTFIKCYGYIVIVNSMFFNTLYDKDRMADIMGTPADASSSDTQHARLNEPNQPVRRGPLDAPIFSSGARLTGGGKCKSGVRRRIQPSAPIGNMIQVM